MPVDPRLFAGPNLGEILQQAQRHQIEMERQRFLIDQARDEANRTGAGRKALSAYLTAPGPGAMPPGAMPSTAPGQAPPPLPGPDASPTGRLGDLAGSFDTLSRHEMSGGAPVAYGSTPAAASAAGPGGASPPVTIGSLMAPDARQTAWEDLARTDPQTALSVRRTQLQDAMSQVEAIGRLAGGATSPETYAAALNQARSMGLDVSGVPTAYDPTFVAMLRRQAMTAAQQITTELASMRLDNDIADDEADNERADANVESEIGYRERSLGLRSAEEAGRNRRFSQGQGNIDRRAREGRGRNGPTPSGVIGRIMDKEARGQPLTPGEQRVIDAYRRGRGRQSGRGSSAPAQQGAIIVNPRTGQRMRLQGNRWVPVG